MTLPEPAAGREDAATRREAAEVATYLAAHPSFLAEHPTLYRTLAPPRRVHGDRLADHMAAMLTLARAETGTVAEAAGAARDLTLRAAGAAVSLIGAADPLAIVANEWPSLLGLDHAVLAAEGPPDVNRRDLPKGTLARLLGTRDLLLRDAPLAEAALLHGEAAGLIRRDALVRLPHGSPGGAPRLLILGARDPACLPMAGSGGALRLLAAALAKALEGALDP